MINAVHDILSISKNIHMEPFYMCHKFPLISVTNNVQGAT